MEDSKREQTQFCFSTRADRKITEEKKIILYY